VRRGIRGSWGWTTRGEFGWPLISRPLHQYRCLPSCGSLTSTYRVRPQAVYVAGATSLILFVGSLAILDAERGAKGATITTFGDAAWWAFTTVTTVGYGDRYPITGQGRFIAGGLMLAGIALLGIVTASLASWLIDKVRELEEHAQVVTRADMTALTAEVRALRAELAARDPAV